MDVTYGTDGSYTLPSALPTADGYVFAGWWFIDGQPATGTWTAVPTTGGPLSAPATAHPLWIPATVNYDNVTNVPTGMTPPPMVGTQSSTDTTAGVGSLPVPSNGQAVDPAATAGQTPDYSASESLPGYNFLGWFAPGSTTPWNFSDPAINLLTDVSGTTASMTLTAEWSQYTLTLTQGCPNNGTPGDGTCNYASDGSDSTVTYNSDGTYTLPTAQPTADGSLFGGWFLINGDYNVGANWHALDGSDAADAPNPLTADEIGYPLWIPATVTYDNSTNLPAGVTALPLVGGTTDTLPTLAGGLATAPTADEQDVPGYTFLGWFDQNGNLWDFSTSTVGLSDVDPATSSASVTLTAEWAPIYTVTFDMNCQSGSTACNTTDPNNLGPVQVANQSIVTTDGAAEFSNTPTDTTGAYTWVCWVEGTVDGPLAGATASDCYTGSITAMSTDHDVYLYGLWKAVPPNNTPVAQFTAVIDPGATLSADGTTVTFTLVVTNTGTDNIDWGDISWGTDGAGVLTFNGCVWVPPDDGTVQYSGADAVKGYATCPFSYAVDPSDAGKTLTFTVSSDGKGVVSQTPTPFTRTTTIDIPAAGVPIWWYEATTGGSVTTPGATGMAGAAILIGLGVAGVVYTRRKAALTF